MFGIKHGLLVAALCSSGCAGIYVELAGTSTPGLKYSANSSSTSGTTSGPVVANDPVSGGFTVGIHAGLDFDVHRKSRWALDYGHESTSYSGGGSGTLSTGGGRVDFNLASISENLKLRGGLGFGFGGGSSSLKATDGTTITRADANGGTAFAGVGVAYYLGTHVVLHGFLGPQFYTQQAPGGGVSGVGVSAKLGVSWVFGNDIPDVQEFEPLDDSLDITGAIQAGAEGIGCRASRGRDTRDNTFAFVMITCDEDRSKTVDYFQVAHGILVTCRHMFESECSATKKRILDSTMRLIEARKGKSAPAPAAPTAPAPSSPPPPNPPPPPAPPSTGNGPTRE